MLKRLSLRVRLTLLSALVTAGMAAALTVVFLVSADLIFVQQLPRELTDVSQTVFDKEETFVVKEKKFLRCRIRRRDQSDQSRKSV